MQSPADVGISQSATKVESEIASNGRTLIQTLPATSIIQTCSVPFSQPTSVSPPIITAARIEKPSNGTPVVTQNNRFVAAAPLTLTPYHIPRGTAAVANITVPKGKIAAPIIRTAAVSHLQPNTTSVSTTTQGFISTLSRPVTTWVVTTPTAAPAILQKTAALNIVSTTCAKPSNTLSVTSRITTPVVTKASELAVKPIILHNPPKQLLTQTSSQLPDRSAGGVLKTNLGMVTIRSTAIASSLPAQTRGAVPVQSSQPPRLTVSVPMLVPTLNTIRKPQQLAPKVIQQPTRAPFTVQSIPVSVSHTPSALTMNKKTAGITIGNNQVSAPAQNTTTVVRTTSTMVPSNSMITVTEIRPESRPVAPTASLLIQATTKPQSAVPSNSNATAFSAPSKTFIYETDNFPVKRTLVSSSTTAFTSTATSFTTAIPRHFNVVTPSISNNQIPRLNPIMVVETPRIATTLAPTSPTSIQPTLTLHPYVIPQAAAIGPIQAQLPQPPTQSQVPLQHLPTQIQQQPPPQPQQRVSPVPQQPVTSMKPNASPRPSILRKRDIDGSLAKVQRNLTPLLNAAPSTSVPVPSPPPSPHMPDMGGGQSSNSSSTLSATSSPGIPSIDPESPTPKAERPLVNVPNEDVENARITTSLIEMSPRKKPRKQQLIANTSSEPKMDDDMEFICDEKIKKEPKGINDTLMNSQEYQKSSSSSSTSSSKKPNISILTGYNHGWKSRHHHFLRYTDVKYKEEKKPSVSDIANQKYVSQKINGWKIYHLSAQMERLHDIEIEVVDKLSSLLKLFTHPVEEDDNHKNLNRTNELIMGNMQRSKVVSDQLIEAKTQMLRVFNHKKHVSDIINKYASKRTIKKKGRY